MAPRVTPVEPLLQRGQVSGRHTGAAKIVRKLKIKHPEMSEVDISKVAGCAPSNVHRVLTSFLGNRYTEESLRGFQERKADIYDALQHRMLGSITDDVIDKAQLLPRVTSAAILEDKARLIRGQATSVNVVVLLDAVESIKQMRRGTPAPQDVVIEAEQSALSAEGQSSDE